MTSRARNHDELEARLAASGQELGLLLAGRVRVEDALDRVREHAEVATEMGEREGEAIGLLAVVDVDGPVIRSRTSPAWLRAAAIVAVLTLVAMVTAIAIARRGPEVGPSGPPATGTGATDRSGNLETGPNVANLVPENAMAAVWQSLGTWETMPVPPVAFRTGHVAAWTGTEMVIWGGAEVVPFGSGDWLNDGAAYNPVTNSWRRIAASPLNARVEAPSVVVAGKVVIAGGWTASVGRHTSAIYDPVRDTWDSIDDVPVPEGIGRDVVLASDGRRAFAWVTTADGDSGAYLRSDGGYELDLLTGTWNPFPAAPFGRGEPTGATSMVWTGAELVVTRVWEAPPSPNEMGTEDCCVRGMEAAAYSPGTRRWRSLPPPSSSLLGPAVWTGRGAVQPWLPRRANFRGPFSNEPSAGSGGWADFEGVPGMEYYPETGVVASLPPAPLEFGDGMTVMANNPTLSTPLMAWTGPRGIAGPGAPPPGRLAFYSEAARRWYTSPGAPLDNLAGATAVWTGSEVLLWGGTMRLPELRSGQASTDVEAAVTGFRYRVPSGSDLAPLAPGEVDTSGVLFLPEHLPDGMAMVEGPEVRGFDLAAAFGPAAVDAPPLVAAPSVIVARHAPDGTDLSIGTPVTVRNRAGTYFQGTGDWARLLIRDPVDNGPSQAEVIPRDDLDLVAVGLTRQELLDFAESLRPVKEVGQLEGLVWSVPRSGLPDPVLPPFVADRPPPLPGATVREDGLERQLTLWTTTRVVGGRRTSRWCAGWWNTIDIDPEPGRCVVPDSAIEMAQPVVVAVPTAAGANVAIVVFQRNHSRNRSMVVTMSLDGRDLATIESRQAFDSTVEVAVVPSGSTVLIKAHAAARADGSQPPDEEWTVRLSTP